MHHAVILAGDLGERLRPLSDDERPISFLALGERRTLLQRCVERLLPVIRPERQWVVVRPRHAALATSQLPAGVHVVVDSHDRKAADVAGRAIAAIGPLSVESAVLVQPAQHVIRDEAAYREKVAAGLATAGTQGVLVVFTATADGGAVEAETGIEARPAGLSGDRASAPVQISLARVGWADVSDWDAVFALLRRVEKPWGREELWALNEHYAGKVLFIKAGEILSLQFHEKKDETIRVLSGQLRLYVGARADALETLALGPGNAYPIPARLIHRMEAVTDCTMVEVSTPHLADVVRLEDRYGRA